MSVGKSIFTIPINNISPVNKKASSADIIHNVDNERSYQNDGRNLSCFLRLHELYNLDTEITEIDDGIIIWVEAAEKSYCLFVDELIGEQQVVVKPLPAYLNSFNIKDSGIAGCTILGDGNISIILDIANLYAKAHNFS